MGGLPAWEGGHPGRHAGWKPALLKEERDTLHSIVICSRSPLTDAAKMAALPREEAMWYTAAKISLC